MVPRCFLLGDLQGESKTVQNLDPISTLCTLDALVDHGIFFSRLLQLTDQFEGSLIRVFRRLQELIRQMSQAAKVIGNTELQEKFDRASEMLGRPNSVIFCSSLYL